MIKKRPTNQSLLRRDPTSQNAYTPYIYSESALRNDSHASRSQWPATDAAVTADQSALEAA